MAYIDTPWLVSGWNSIELTQSQEDDKVLLLSDEAQELLSENPRLKLTIKSLADTIARLPIGARDAFFKSLPQDIQWLLGEWAELERNGLGDDDSDDTKERPLPDFIQEGRNVNLSESGTDRSTDEAARWFDSSRVVGADTSATQTVDDEGFILANNYAVENAKYRPAINLSESEKAEEDAFVEAFRAQMW